tara:strand:- start:852 stop:1028 length:177 start_codon:yes stop_codon:yes gene_type:complete
MNETNKFVDAWYDFIQAQENAGGFIELYTFGNPAITPDQAIEFAKQLTELAQEVKSKQ